MDTLTLMLIGQYMAEVQLSGREALFPYPAVNYNNSLQYFNL